MFAELINACIEWCTKWFKRQHRKALSASTTQYREMNSAEVQA